MVFSQLDGRVIHWTRPVPPDNLSLLTFLFFFGIPATSGHWIHPGATDFHSFVRFIRWRRHIFGLDRDYDRRLKEAT